MNIELKLSAQGLSDINESIASSYFTFIVNGETFHTRNCYADFISPNVARNHKIDPLNDAYQIYVDNNINKFDFFMSLARKGFESYDSRHIDYYVDVASQLGNKELISLLLPSYQKEDLTENNIIEKIIFSNHHNMDITELITYAALNFESIKDQLCLLPYELIDLILSSDDLIVSDEGSLLSFVLSLIEANGEYYKALLSKIHFTELSAEQVQTFLSHITYEDVDSDLWNSISLRLLLEIPDILCTRKRSNKYSNLIEPIRNNIFDGIFNMLNKTCNGNCVENGLIKVLCSNQKSGSVANLFNYNDFSQNSRCCTVSLLNVYYEIDFCDKLIQLHQYAFHVPNEWARDFPSTWSIEASNDRFNWTIIDNVLNDVHLMKGGDSYLYTVKNTKSGFFKYYRIYQRGLNNPRNMPDRYFFGLSGLEFFGEITIK